MYELLKLLIPFDLLVDTDMGILKFIQFNYQGNSNYYPGIMSMVEHDHNIFLFDVLKNRPFPNPLSAIVKEEKMIIINPDEMLNNLISSGDTYKEILKYSTSTSLLELVGKSLFLQDAVRYDVICRNKMEEEELLNRYRRMFDKEIIPLNIIIEEDYSKINLSEYGNLYIKYLDDLEKYNKEQIEGKNIFIINYRFNVVNENDVSNKDSLDIVKEKVEKLKPFINCNKFTYINLYPKTNNIVG